MDFLDTTVKVDTDGSLYTTLFTKPTDTHTFLHHTSAHPPHQTKSGPYSELVMVKRICTNQSDYDIYSENLLTYYTHKGYPDSVIASTRQKASTHDRATLLVDWSLNNEISQPTNDDNLHVIITYNPANPDVKGTNLDRFWPILNSSKNLDVIHHKKIIIGHSRNTNLRNILVKARIRFPSIKRLNQVSGKITNVCVYTSNIVCVYCPKSRQWGAKLCALTQAGCIKHQKVVVVAATIWYTLSLARYVTNNMWGRPLEL